MPSHNRITRRPPQRPKNYVTALCLCTFWSALANGAPTDIDLPGDPRVHVPDAQRTIAQKMPDFRRCFDRAEASGKIFLGMTVAPSGAVTDALAAGDVPRAVRLCVQDEAFSLRFSEPQGGRTALLRVPVSVIRQ